MNQCLRKKKNPRFWKRYAARFQNKKRAENEKQRKNISLSKVFLMIVVDACCLRACKSVVFVISLSERSWDFADERRTEDTRDFTRRLKMKTASESIENVPPFHTNNPQPSRPAYPTHSYQHLPLIPHNNDPPSSNSSPTIQALFDAKGGDCSDTTIERSGLNYYATTLQIACTVRKTQLPSLETSR